MSETRAPNRLELERELIWRRCEQDPWYFIFGFVKVLVVGKGYQKFEEWDHQPEIIAWMHSKHVDEPSKNGALKARQVGWTTIGNAFALWSMFFHPNHPWLQVSVGQDEAAAALQSKIKVPYSMLPTWMRARGPAVTRDTAEEFGFENGSYILAIPSTARSGRSRAMYGCLFDEAAFMVDAEEVFAGVEPMVYGPIFVFSTANGMGGFFHETYVESLAPDSVWDFRFYPWSVVPGRDLDWYNWRKLGYRGREHLFYQEFPQTEAEAFMRSGRTAYDLELLEADHDWSEPLFRLDLQQFEFHKMLDRESQVEASKIPPGKSRDLELWVWREPEVERDAEGIPIRDPNYGIGVDVSEGLAHGDFSAISVRDVNHGEQVATVRSHIPIYDLGPIVEQIGYWYHTALVGVERNNFGLVPLQYLQDAGYPRLYRMDSIAEMKRGSRTARYGWITSRSTKPKMVQDLAKALSGQEISLHDRRWLQEATTFVSTGTGRYEASPPNTDDLMIAELIAHQMELEVGRFPVVWRDPKPGPATFADVFAIMSYDAKSDTDEMTLLDRPLGQPDRRGPDITPSFPIKIKGQV